MVKGYRYSKGCSVFVPSVKRSKKSLSNIQNVGNCVPVYTASHPKDLNQHRIVNAISKRNFSYSLDASPSILSLFSIWKALMSKVQVTSVFCSQASRSWFYSAEYEVPFFSLYVLFNDAVSSQYNITQRRWKMNKIRVCTICGMMVTEENRSVWTENCPVATLSNRNPTQDAGPIFLFSLMLGKLFL